VLSVAGAELEGSGLEEIIGAEEIEDCEEGEGFGWGAGTGEGDVRSITIGCRVVSIHEKKKKNHMFSFPCIRYILTPIVECETIQVEKLPQLRRKSNQ
jgi:hypothetical protein